MTPDAWIVVIVVVYMAGLLGLGAAASRLARDPEQYWLAGRSLGSWVTAVSSTASSESGWVVLGAVGMAYKDGLSALWFAPGCLLGYAVNLYFLAPRIRRIAARQGSLTLLDLIADRLGGPVRTLRIVGAVVILCCLGGYVAAQLTATGKAMEAILGMPYARGVIVGGGIVVVYTLLGGFRAVAWTDFLQGLVMVGALVVMPLLVVAEVGGYHGLLARLEAVHPALVEPTGNLTGALLFGSVTGLLGIGLGYPGQPHVLTRYMAASSDEKIRQTQVIAMVWGVLVFYGAGFLGLAGRVLLPELMTQGDPEQLFPLLARRMLHPLVAGIMLAAILSAIMSTVSSQLLVAASTVSRDVLERILGLGRGSRALVTSGRLAVLVLGTVAILVAMRDVRLVFWFVLYAWSGLGAAFGPVLLLALTTRRVTGWGAVAGMITGFLVTVAWKQSGLSESMIYELVPAFLSAALATLAVSTLDRARRTTEAR